MNLETLTLDRSSGDPESEKRERDFQLSINEGTRATIENNQNWAMLCWRSAFLDLESLCGKLIWIHGRHSLGAVSGCSGMVPS